MDIKNKLKSFGLNSYEADAYYYLLTKGVCDANEIHKETKIPFGKIYQVLNALNEKRLIEIQNSRPKKYAAKDLDEALNNFIKFKENEMQTEINFAKETAENIKATLTQNVNSDLKKETFWLGGFDEEAKGILESTLSKVNKKIYLLVEPPGSFQNNIIFETLIKYRDKFEADGIDIKILIKTKNSFDFNNFNKIKTNKDVEIKRIKHPVKNPHLIIDNNICIFPIKNPIDDNLMGAIKIEDQNLNSELTNNFLKIWSSLLQ